MKGKSKTKHIWEKKEGFVVRLYDLIHWLSSEFWTYVEKSYTWTDDPTKFPTKFVQFPVSTFLFPCLVTTSSITQVLMMAFVDDINFNV